MFVVYDQFHQTGTRWGSGLGSAVKVVCCDRTRPACS